MTVVGYHYGYISVVIKFNRCAQISYKTDYFCLSVYLHTLYACTSYIKETLPESFT